MPLSAEQKFAQALGQMPTTPMQKIASKMNELSVDELETILRGEMKKTAFAITPEGHRIGARQGDYAAAKHEKGQNAYNPFGGMGTKSRMEKKEEKKEKVSSVEEETFQEKVASADAWGRELARTVFEKLALGVPGAVGMGVGKALNAVTGAGMGMRAGVGAAGGAALGAAKNIVAPQRDANGNARPGGVVRGALMGAAGGAALGAGAKKAVTAVGSSKGAVGAQTRRLAAHSMGPAGMAPVQAGGARQALNTMRANAVKPAKPMVPPAPTG